MFNPHYVSRVTCHLSRVTCHLLHVKIFIFYIFYIKKKSLKKVDKMVELVGGGSFIYEAYLVQFILRDASIPILSLFNNPSPWTQCGTAGSGRGKLLTPGGFHGLVLVLFAQWPVSRPVYWSHTMLNVALFCITWCSRVSSPSRSVSIQVLNFN